MPGPLEKAFKHYLREDVELEIARFCRERWVAVECVSKDGRRVFHRYWRRDVPLTIFEPADLKKILNRFGKARPRTIYGSANVYRRISSKEDLSAEENIAYATPSWDIDGSLEEVDLIKEAAGILLDELRRNGVEKSVYLIWSGRGIHIHLNERAINDNVWEKGPLRVSFSVVEYALRNVREELLKVCGRSRASERKLKIENIMDVQRVFTAPLSLHRELDIVAVTVDPDELDQFDLSWTRLDSFRYWRDWSRYEDGEADDLALKALEAIKGEERMLVSGGETGFRAMKTRPIQSVGRFQVMALLQAARYYVLKEDLDLAKSFGLNRAIFYAWAKKRGAGVRRGTRRGVGKIIEREEFEEKIGDEVAFRSPRGWFVIGGQIQRPMDFDQQIAARFGNWFKKYWDSALEYVKSFPREVLESQREFYENVYRPVRDDPEKILNFQGMKKCGERSKDF